MFPFRVLLAVSLLLMVCCAGRSATLRTATDGGVPVEQADTTLAIGSSAVVDGLTLELVRERVLSRPSGGGMTTYRLRAGETDVEGTSELFVDELVVGDKLLTVLGWTDTSLVVSVGPAPISEPLDEDAGAAQAMAELTRRGYDVDNFNFHYELTAGEGAVHFVLMDDERPLAEVLVGLYSGHVLTCEVSPAR